MELMLQTSAFPQVTTWGRLHLASFDEDVRFAVGSYDFKICLAEHLHKFLARLMSLIW